MEQYRAHQEGPDPSTKLRDNVASKVYRIKRFIAYMAQGGGKLQTLDFLNQTERMRRQDQWVKTLRTMAIRETTINHYLKNIAQFMDYVAATHPPTCRLPKRVLFSIRREMRMMLPCMKRPARNNGSVEDRLKLSHFMCHDTRTADKFYACNLNTKEAWEHRQLFEKVLEGPDVPDEPIGKVGKRPCKRKRCENASPLDSQTTSEDEAEPVYQESGVSSVESEENSSDGDPSEARPSVAKPLRQTAIVLTPLKIRWSPAESPHKLGKEYPSSA
ncbi:hypothetical protein E1301_Tti023204 [Triplophysa tibetana]|uniref:Uncharacterized protein n=1 Tax=Triplophysa tibetana TaxID=1572043 RepID=A0A5A9MT56_9TELE|nr:hypothetical protein E1301_Tti023204 [Triplophysa tibetana]